MPLPSQVAILGITGFIGHGLPEWFARKGIGCTGVSRSGAGCVPGVEVWQTPDALDLSGQDAVVNLAGEPIARRWTANNRRLFHESRVGLTRRVVDAMRALPAAARPKVLVNASAVGIYGDRGDQVLTEASGAGRGFLADLCVEWEAAALEAEALGVRVVCLRTGVVLGRDAPAFRKLHSWFKAGLGGRLGSGRQWMPWIHCDDLRAIIVRAVLGESLWGPINCTAPAADRNRDFTRKLAAAIRRPALLPVPACALKLALGDFGTALLASQHARPAALEADDFTFGFPTLELAFDQIVGELPASGADDHAVSRIA